jgi:MinD-like ATPase involved in chromosome partitioning or flagellar assembly
MVPESTTCAIPLVVYSQNSPAAVEFRKIAQALLTHIRARRRVSASQAENKKKCQKTGFIIQSVEGPKIEVQRIEKLGT